MKNRIIIAVTIIILAFGLTLETKSYAAYHIPMEVSLTAINANGKNVFYETESVEWQVNILFSKGTRFTVSFSDSTGVSNVDTLYNKTSTEFSIRYDKAQTVTGYVTVTDNTGQRATAKHTITINKR